MVMRCCVGEDLRIMSSKSACCVIGTNFKYVGEVLLWDYSINNSFSNYSLYNHYQYSFY